MVLHSSKVRSTFDELELIIIEQMIVITRKKVLPAWTACSMNSLFCPTFCALTPNYSCASVSISTLILLAFELYKI